MCLLKVTSNADEIFLNMTSIYSYRQHFSEKIGNMNRISVIVTTVNDDGICRIASDRVVMCKGGGTAVVVFVVFSALEISVVNRVFEVIAVV